MLVAPLERSPIIGAVLRINQLSTRKADRATAARMIAPKGNQRTLRETGNRIKSCDASQKDAQNSLVHG